MMDIETIRAMNAARARSARTSGLQPLVYDGNPETLRRIPNMGDYRATKHGWKLINKLLVDSSGFGADDEPALTFKQFSDRAVVGRGYGIITEGQFQVVVGEFTKTR